MKTTENSETHNKKTVEIVKKRKNVRNVKNMLTEREKPNIIH